MKYVLKCLYLWLSFLLSLATDAEITGEVIFRHPDNPNELWIADVENTDNAHLLFKQKHPIQKLSVQKNGPFIVTTAKSDNPTFPFDVYLVDRSEVLVEEHNLTHKIFTEILDVKVSQYGDIFFLNNQIITNINRAPPPSSGIYFIPNYDIEKFINLEFSIINIPGPAPDLVLPKKKHLLLKGVETNRVALSPNRHQIAYDTEEGVFLFNLNTGEVVQISRGGSFPAFSPDGKKIAYVYRYSGFAHEIEILSTDTLRYLGNIEKLENHVKFLDLKWSNDGKYIVYTIYGGGADILKQIPPDTSYHNHAVTLDGKERFNILDGIFDNGVPMFDWVTSEVSYTVEPKNRLTTLWGKLKQ
ncbi:PD40 domain-containing protein [Candidatus Poribacteria bacterium]|nr:PD40 domain-containing protein [Candidatus Poribacteria bacterium]